MKHVQTNIVLVAAICERYAKICTLLVSVETVRDVNGKTVQCRIFGNVNGKILQCRSQGSLDKEIEV